MTEFRVTLASSHPIAAVTADGHMAKRAKFHIQRLSDRKGYIYEGHGGGERFELKCSLLNQAGGVLVGAENPDSDPPSTSWKEKLVNAALDKAEHLQ